MTSKKSRQDAPARDYLERLRRIAYVIGSLEQHRKYVIEETTRITASLNGVCVQHDPSDPTARGAISVGEYDAFLRDRIQDLAKMRMEAFCLIDKIPDARLQEVLVNRYVHNWSWDKVSAEMHFEIAWVFKLHGYALQEFEKVYAELENGNQRELPEIRQSVKVDSKV